MFLTFRMKSEVNHVKILTFLNHMISVLIINVSFQTRTFDGTLQKSKLKKMFKYFHERTYQ